MSTHTLTHVTCISWENKIKWNIESSDTGDETAQCYSRCYRISPSSVPKTRFGNTTSLPRLPTLNKSARRRRPNGRPASTFLPPPDIYPGPRTLKVWLSPLSSQAEANWGLPGDTCSKPGPTRVDAVPERTGGEGGAVAASGLAQGGVWRVRLSSKRGSARARLTRLVRTQPRIREPPSRKNPTSTPHGSVR